MTPAARPLRNTTGARVVVLCMGSAESTGATGAADPGTLVAYVVGDGGTPLATINTVKLADGRRLARVDVDVGEDDDTARIGALQVLAAYLDDAATQLRRLAREVAGEVAGEVASDAPPEYTSSILDHAVAALSFDEVASACNFYYARVVRMSRGALNDREQLVGRLHQFHRGQLALAMRIDREQFAAVADEVAKDFGCVAAVVVPPVTVYADSDEADESGDDVRGDPEQFAVNFTNLNSPFVGQFGLSNTWLANVDLDVDLDERHRLAEYMRAFLRDRPIDDGDAS